MRRISHATSCQRPRIDAAALCAALAMLLVSALPAGAAPANRIAVLDPGHAEILMALGLGRALVLVPEDPALAGRIPGAERYHRMPSAEGLLAQRPDLLIGGNPARDRALMTQADRLGIDSVMIPRTLPAPARIGRIAARVGREARGREIVAGIKADYAAAQEVVDGAAPVRVLHVSSSGAGSSGAVTGAGAGTSADGLIRRAGGVNVGAEAGLERYQSLSAEGVIAMAPEAVLVSRRELAALGGRSGIWERVPGLVHTPAARDRRLIVLGHSAVKFDAVSSGEATLMLARALHGDD